MKCYDGNQKDSLKVSIFYCAISEGLVMYFFAAIAGWWCHWASKGKPNYRLEQVNGTMGDMCVFKLE